MVKFVIISEKNKVLMNNSEYRLTHDNGYMLDIFAYNNVSKEDYNWINLGQNFVSHVYCLPSLDNLLCCFTAILGVDLPLMQLRTCSLSTI